MQEALISLMQMAKTSAIIERMKQAGVPLHINYDRTLLMVVFQRACIIIG